MRKIATTILALILLSVTASLAKAADGEAKNVTNKVCPVSGGPVSEKFRTEYKGQYVYLCCEGCVKDFEKNPEAFVSKLSKEDQEAIEPNKVCPISGEPVDAKIFVENEGRKVYFCCEHCRDKFKKDHPDAK
jgi:YHS domain-containing protein